MFNSIIHPITVHKTFKCLSHYHHTKSAIKKLPSRLDRKLKYPFIILHLQTSPINPAIYPTHPPAQNTTLRRCANPRRPPPPRRLLGTLPVTFDLAAASIRPFSARRGSSLSAGDGARLIGPRFWVTIFGRRRGGPGACGSRAVFREVAQLRRLPRARRKMQMRALNAKFAVTIFSERAHVHTHTRAGERARGAEVADSRYSSALFRSDVSRFPAGTLFRRARCYVNARAESRGTNFRAADARGARRALLITPDHESVVGRRYVSEDAGRE